MTEETRRTKKFKITEEHLKLLKGLEIGWNAMEFGAPSTDPKRPYGNSNVYKDMIEALGWKFSITVNNITENYDLSSGFYIEENETPEELKKVLFDLYRQLDRVLEICLRTLSFEPGIYESDVYEDNWKKVL
ncbi:hypothetical protein KAU33_04420 [Candidatus Dependentiae bacterium]|nr:hypothetical protein [Candidatus Dependentiae bacterium]